MQRPDMLRPTLHFGSTRKALALKDELKDERPLVRLVASSCKALGTPGPSFPLEYPHFQQLSESGTNFQVPIRKKPNYWATAKHCWQTSALLNLLLRVLPLSLRTRRLWSRFGHYGRSLLWFLSRKRLIRTWPVRGRRLTRLQVNYGLVSQPWMPIMINPQESVWATSPDYFGPDGLNRIRS